MYPIYLVLISILFLILLLLILGGFWGAMWIPTKRRDYDRIAEQADLRPGMVFYDLGSGSGNLLFYLSKRYKIMCVGIEISPILYSYSKIKSLFYKKVKIKYGDFFKHDLSKADAIYAFLRPKMYKKLKEKLNQNAKKDSIIILSCWPLEDTEPSQISRKNKEITYYSYKKLLLWERL